MSVARCGALGSLAVLLLAVAACTGAPEVPPADRTPLATSQPDVAPTTAVAATATPAATGTPDSALVAALGPLGLSGLASQFVTPRPLLAPPVVPTATATLAPTATPTPAPASRLPAAAAAALPAPSDTPLPAAVLLPSPVPAGLPPMAVTDANIRTGPGLEFTIAGSVRAGTVLDIVACNADRTWYRLSDGNWVFADLVANAPRALQVVDPPAS